MAKPSLPRGIAPDLLLSQVKNTMPYLVAGTPLDAFPPTRIVLEFEKDPTRELTHFEYFRLCLSAHYLTVATPVPTDVDNQIRKKLWPAELPLETALQMASLVLESHDWNFSLVTRRISHGLSGHLGEWFTVACGAYCAMKQYGLPEAREMERKLFDAIAAEVRNHSEVFGGLWRGGDGLGALKTSAALAHNFGDLDRVMDMWDLGVGDPLRLEFYKLGVTPFDTNRKLRYLGRLWVAGELYKSVIDGSSMALENHRHYALRKLRVLREHPDLMITTGPFFDDWGEQIARHVSDLEGFVSALKDAWDRQPKTLGYGRALAAIYRAHSGLPVDGIERVHDFRQALGTPRERFEKKWANEALRLMEDIPSRA